MYEIATRAATPVRMGATVATIVLQSVPPLGGGGGVGGVAGVVVAKLLAFEVEGLTDALTDAEG